MPTGDAFRAAAVAFLWAACYPLISLGADAAPPLAFAGLRASIAGAVVLALSRARGGGWTCRGKMSWLTVAAAGFTNTSLGFAGMFLGGRLVTPGLATVLANTQPLVAGGLAAVFLRETVTGRRLGGSLIAFAGIVLLASPSALGGGSSGGLPGIGLVLGAALGVAAGNVLLKHLARTEDAFVAIGWQFLFGVPPLLTASLMTETWEAEWYFSKVFLLLLCALAVGGTALPFVLWYRLLQQYDLIRLNVFTYLTPLFGLTLGYLFFDERLSYVEISGVAAVMGGVVSGARR